MTAPMLSAPDSTVNPSASANEILNDDATWAKIAGPLATEEVEPDTGEPPAEGPPRDEKGRFTRAEEQAAEAEEGVAESATTESQELTEPEAEAEPEPEPEPEAPKPKLATQFTVHDGEGEVELPPIEIEFKANGELRKMPLDKVVRLAQSGFYNERLQSEVKETRAKSAEFEQAIAERDQALQQVMRAWQDIMERGDEYFLAQREQYQQRNSPEARAARLEAEVRQERAKREQVEVSVRAQSFLEHTLQPKLAALQSQYGTVSDAEAAGWLAPQLKALEVQGVIPPSRYAAVERLLDEDLGPWMAQLHTQRTETTKAAEATRKLELRKAKADLTKVKRELTKAASPARTPGGTAAKATPKATTAKVSANEAFKAFWRSQGDTDDEE